jgi:putative endonuclease
MSQGAYYVYVLTNRSGSLYVGVTNDLERRILEHRSGLTKGFTSRYKLDRLIYFEDCGEILDAIAREKQIKSWRRSKKLALIATLNPNWDDLGSEGSARVSSRGA